MADSIGLIGGTVVDPEADLHAAADVLVEDGLIAAVGVGAASGAGRVINCKGSYVLPGLIDSHTHTFARTSNIGAPLQEGCLERGVIAAIDAGSAGAATFSAYEHLISTEAPIPAWSFINVSSIGIADLKVGELRDPGYFDLPRLREIIERYDPLIKGIKVRLSRNVMGGPCVDRLRQSVELAEEYHRPVMVHLGDSIEPLWDILPVLRAGDIVSHVYTANENNILDNGHVHPSVFEARDRGVLYDCAHGSSNFSFPVARVAVAEGLWPNTVSSDLSLRNWRGPVFDLPTTMSKLLMLGMDFDALIAATTATPSKIFGLSDEGFGTIRVGTKARLTVLRDDPAPKPVTDSVGNAEETPILEPVCAIQGYDITNSVPRAEHKGWPRPF